MKKIIYTRTDGGISVVSPTEGCRLAYAVVLDGKRYEDLRLMKEASGVELAQYERVAHPADQFLRGWPVAGAIAEWAETEDQWLARVQAKSVTPGATAIQIVEDSAIPADRTFRNAWQISAGKVVCDMPKARGLARDMLRAERAERFTRLDGEWMRAMGRGEALEAAAVEAKRETMRNWPQDPRIESATTQEELKSTIQSLKAEV